MALSTKKEYDFFSKKFLNYLDSKVNIIDLIVLKHYKSDNDYILLKNRLALTRKKKFENNDFYLISHFDTDYYLPGCPYGLIMYNFVRTLQELDISLSKVIIVTNILNLLSEIKNIIPVEKQQYNLPIVIDNCLSTEKYLYYDNLVDIKISTNVKKHAITLLGRERVHRHALYNFINDNRLTDKVITSYRNNHTHESKNID